MAKLAGVSCATISRVLNDSGYVKEDTRKKVMEIIREYNYTPNMIARSLSSKDSFNIGEREQRESENRFVFHNVRFELAVCNSILVVRIIHRARPEFAAVRL